MAFYDYINNDTIQRVLNPLGTTIGSLVDRMFGGGTTSSSSSNSSSSIWGDLGNIAGNYESALMEAEAILGPQYQRAREQTMSEVDRSMVSRGFYGQAPGDAIRASTLTDLDTAYQSALGNYATNIMDRRTQLELQKEQMELQKYMFDKEMEEQRKQSKDRKKSGLLSGIGGVVGGIFGGPAGSAIGSAAGNILSSIFS